MNTTHASQSTVFKVGAFVFVGLVAIILVTVLVNNRPYWWRPCQFVSIHVKDATGLKPKSPIRSLGIEIGYLKSVALSESHVTLGICLTAPVELLPTTNALIRGEGFLGDKFVELKPVRYRGPREQNEKNTEVHEQDDIGDQSSFQFRTQGKPTMLSLLFLMIHSTWAATTPATSTQVSEPGAIQPAKKAGAGREIPVVEESQDVQRLVNRVDELVRQMSGLTNNLKEAINPEDLRKTMKQLNQTLENASKTLSPEGGLNQTAQRTLAKLEDAIEQLRDMMTRINKGEGSVGMLLNDPSYAEELRLAIKNINRLLTKVGDVRFVVDLGGSYLPSYSGGRGWIHLGIWPKPDRYYLLGISQDPRGKISNSTTTTTVGGTSQTVQTQSVDQTGILITGMLGKVFYDRIDLSIGALYGDGTGSVAFRLGPNGYEDRIVLRDDIYFRNSSSGIDNRVTLTVRPYSIAYLRAGLESIRNYNGQLVFSFGGGITFDDEDIKLLFALK